MVTTRNILLYPFSVLYGVITAIRNFLYNSRVLHSESFDLPVICVGNITVGGTGKTPHTEYLAELLSKQFRVAVLSRGYRRKTSDFRLVTPSSEVTEVGDEPLQMKRKFPGVMVTVDRKRAAGIWRILDREPGTDVVILDDAYQHRRVNPGLTILLSDFDRPFYRDHMLPYGNLREYSSNIDRAEIILITKCPSGISAIQRRLIVKEIGKAAYQTLYFTSYSYKAPVPVFPGQGDQEGFPEPDMWSEYGAVVVTGIANPGPFRAYLKSLFRETIELGYPDHHQFGHADLKSIESALSNLKATGKYVITTEKDATRLRTMTGISDKLKSAFYYIPIGIEFLNEDKEEFDNIITDYVRKNRINSRISKGKGI
jgi:tetraacyldisaccharide 4'-kinase